MYLKILAFITPLYFAFLPIKAQVRVDTITSSYILNFDKNDAIYKYQNQEGTASHIEIEQAYQKDYKHLHPKYSKSEKVKPGLDLVFFDEKLTKLDNFEPVYPHKFDKINGEIESYYVVSRNDSCFLLHKEDWSLRFFHELYQK